MEDDHKTRKQLISELAEMRQKIAELEASEGQRARAEEAMIKERDLLGILMDNLPDPAYVKDAEGRYVATNPAHARALGLETTEQIVGKTALDLFPEELARRYYYSDDQRVLRSGEPLTNRAELVVDSEGRERWFLTSKVPLRDEGGSVVGLVGVSRDITERKRAEEALARERDLLHILMDNIPDAIYFKDADSRFTRINRACARMMGIDNPEEAVGQTDFDFYPQESAKVFYTQERQMVASKEPAIDLTGRREMPDGHYRWLAAAKVPIIDEQGQVTGILGITRDITDRKRAKEALQEYSKRLEEMVEERTHELRDAQERLTRREELAFLGQLAGSVGHELRTPLGAITNAAYYLRMVTEEPSPEVKDTLDIIELETANCVKITDDLLSLARTKSPVRLEVDVNRVVQEALSRAAIPEEIECVSQLDRALPPILADAGQLGQVFGNIIRNAFQAMPHGGRLAVGSQVASPGWVRISFADTGVGIPEENLGDLFDPLFTTKARGIGLGLTLSRMLVERHGGTIEVESEPGVGTTFTVRLPINGEPASSEVEGPTAPPGETAAE